MIGGTIKKLLEERGTNVNELANKTGIPAQTLYSVVRRDSMRIDFDVLLRICEALDAPLELFYKGRSPELPNSSEWELIRRWREMDEHGRRLTGLVMEAELLRTEDAASEKAPPPDKIIPLYLTAAAAGYASPVMGEDYEDYAVPHDSPADFAVKIAGVSMAPWIPDGSVALVKRGGIIRDGDVGLFFADGGMVCKQYCQDYAGNVYLFSLNRAAKASDLHFPASSDIPLCCFGKVLMKEPVPLP